MSQATVDVTERMRFDEAALVAYLTAKRVPGTSGKAMTVRKFGYGAFGHVSRPACN